MPAHESLRREPAQQSEWAAQRLRRCSLLNWPRGWRYSRQLGRRLGMGKTTRHGPHSCACDDPRMQIHSPCVVTLSWTLTDAQNRPIDELPEPVEFFVGGSDLLPKVEEALLGQEMGFETRLHLEPEHAFGDYKAELVCFEDRSLFPKELEAGMHFEGLPEGAKTTGMPADAIYTVTEVYDTHVVLDGNHPLAGIALRLQLKVLDVREASAEEIEAGSVGEAPAMLAGASRAGNTRH
jgi:FKBP-type peptidyl-prolyl cis-trans isomerase SlyD